MLVDELRKAVGDMEEIRDLEQDSQDSQRQSRIDRLYVAEVNDNHKIVHRIENSRKFITFIPSSSLKKQVLQLLEDSNRCVESGFAQETRLKTLQKSTKNIREQFANEWNTFYYKISSRRLHILTAIKEITLDKEKTGYTINKIKNGAIISYEDDNRVKLLADGISEADDIFDQLGIEKEGEIMVFLDKVAGGSATLSDLTDAVIKWIEEKGLSDKFFIKFGS